MEETTVNQVLTEKLTITFGNKLSAISAPYGLLTFSTSADLIIEVLTYLKDELSYNFLTDITAVHYPGKKEGIAVIYHLHNMVERSRVRVKVFLNEQKPSVPTATVLWEGANWMERETYDFYGVNFEGHPNLLRILNMDDLGVFPMLKQYPLEDPNRVDKKDEFFGR